MNQWLMFILGCAAAPALAQPEVNSVSPAWNQIGVSPDTDVSVTFDVAMDPASLSDSTVRAIGSQSGLHAGAVLYDGGTMTVTLDPAIDFRYGELVTVTLTGAIESDVGDPLVGYAWSFTIESLDAPATFPTRADVSSSTSVNLGVADFDLDGRLDVATSTYNVGGPSGSFLYVNFNEGDFEFSDPDVYSVGSAPAGLAAGDLNGDGAPDLVAANRADLTLSVLFNNGDGTFAAEVVMPVDTSVSDVVLTDIDADGDTDLLLGAYPTSRMNLYRNDGTGTFGVLEQIDVGGDARTPIVADFNGDGLLDIAFAQATQNRVGLLMASAPGVFDPVVTFATEWEGPWWLAAGDVNLDGLVDLAVSEQVDGYVSIYLSVGGGSFVHDESFEAGDQMQGVHLADFSGNGFLDLVATDWLGAPTQISVWMHDGTGFDPPFFLQTIDDPFGVTSADVNNDGLLDLLVADDALGIFPNEMVVAVPSDVHAFTNLHASAVSPRRVAVGFELARSTTVSVRVLDVAGRLVKTLAENALFARGSHEVIWSADAAPGVYFVQLRSPLGRGVARAVLVR